MPSAPARFAAGGAIVILLGLVAMGCRTAAPVGGGPDPAFCEKQPERCAQLCARCPEDEGCRAHGGECAQAANGDLKDDVDGGPNVFQGGCHKDYPAGACPNGGVAWIGDWCNDEIHIEEWTNGQCHGAQGDHQAFDCDRECLAAGFGHGRCVNLPRFCGGNIDSARCECERGQPPSGPTSFAATRR